MKIRLQFALIRAVDSRLSRGARMRFQQVVFSDRAGRVFAFGLGVMTGGVVYNILFVCDE